MLELNWIGGALFPCCPDCGACSPLRSPLLQLGSTLPLPSLSLQSTRWFSASRWPTQVCRHTGTCCRSSNWASLQLPTPSGSEALIMSPACSHHPKPSFPNTALRCSPTGPVCLRVHDGPAAGTCKCRGLAGSRMRRPAVGLLGRTRHSTVQVCVRVCSATPAGLVQHCRSACLRRAPTRQSPVRLPPSQTCRPQWLLAAVALPGCSRIFMRAFQLCLC